MPPKKPKTENLDDLKQELDIDFHKVTAEELYQRFQTHPENVSLIANWKSGYGNIIIFLFSHPTGSQSCQGKRKFRT